MIGNRGIVDQTTVIEDAGGAADLNGNGKAARVKPIE